MKAITATAHKLAKIIYNMLRDGVEYKDVNRVQNSLINGAGH
jgi:hypothetical protein